MYNALYFLVSDYSISLSLGELAATLMPTASAQLGDEGSAVGGEAGEDGGVHGAAVLINYGEGGSTRKIIMIYL